jgi:hypothetical protein
MNKDLEDEKNINRLTRPCNFQREILLTNGKKTKKQYFSCPKKTVTANNIAPPPKS